LPCLYEGYGIVYAETLEHGLPIIACDVRPVPELIGGGAAILVPLGDADVLSGALAPLLGDVALRDRMSAAAYRRANHLPR
jgi:glycosyltransferase involved in cell wall biosynthesis